MYQTFNVKSILATSIIVCYNIAMSDTKKSSLNSNDELVERITEERKAQAWADFEKSVLEVAEAFFAMSEEERKDMVEYVEAKRDEAERQATGKVSSKKEKATTAFKFCPECGAKLEKGYKFCPQCGRALTDKKDK